jgi:formate/nitrite transporter FocA (FNT family)
MSAAEDQTRTTTSAAPDPTGITAYSPADIAIRVEKVGVDKARLPALSVMVLAVLAGAFIAFGAMFYTLVVTGNGLGFELADALAASRSHSG